jgi:hypothetical protein
MTVTGGVLKYFLGPLALVLTGLAGGMGLALLLLPLAGPPSGRFDTSGPVGSVAVGTLVGFAAGSAASAYFFGRKGLVLPAVLAAVLGVAAVRFLRRWHPRN